MSQSIKTTLQNIKIWQISREYAGIAEAGGVKDVCCSLAEGLLKQGAKVTHFIPLYGCTNLKDIQDFDTFQDILFYFEFNKKVYRVHFAQGWYKGVRIIFIINTNFTQKNGVYTYTVLDDALDSTHKMGNGHDDAVMLDLMFQLAVLQYSLKTGDTADIIHCQDAATAFIPFFARNMDCFKNFYKNVSFVISIHNAGKGYHHALTVSDVMQTTGLLEKYFKNGTIEGKAEPYLLSEPFATITTVSPWYADEIVDSNNEATGGLSKAFAERNTHIIGITNGIDYEKYNPTDIKKSLLDLSYNPEIGDFEGKLKLRKRFVEYYGMHHENVVNIIKNLDFIQQYGFLKPDDDSIYLSFHGRIVEQKGIDIIETTAKMILEKSKKFCFIIIGQGTADLEKRCIELANHYLGNFLYLKGYERAVARQCVAIADFVLLPSYFEPCCLEDFIAQIFGTIPIAHAAGGLCKIINGKTGILYKENTPEILSKILLDLLKEKNVNTQKFADIAQYAAVYIHKTYSWEKVIETYYVPLYLNL